MSQTIQQQRAAFALERVNSLVGDRNVDQGEFKAYASELPAMIHMNGLGQTAAFFRSKGGTRRHHYGILSQWLCREGQPYHGQTDLLDGITQGDQRSYRLAQAEALALMDWVKKFAKAFMED